jgi:hypothetical protein
MTRSSAAERLPLTGADCFLRAFDAETRRFHRAGHLSQLVLRLGPGFEPGTLERVLAEVARAQPILVAPIRRRAGVGAPVYRLDLGRRGRPPRVRLHEAQAPTPEVSPRERPLPALFAQRLSAVHDGRRGDLLRVDALRYDGGRAGTDLAFTWLHMLFDGSGSEAFVAFLEACRSGARSPHEVPEADRPGAAPDQPLPASARERGGMAMAWQRWMHGLGARGVRSLAGPRRRLPQDLAVELRAFPAPESVRIRERAAERAGFLTPMLFYLAAAIRAHHAVLKRRGAVPESYVVPLPVNLRPRGREGGIFRTRVSMVWFQVDAARADDLDALLEALKAQRRTAIRDGQVANGVAAMDFARFAPAPVYAHMARRPLRGELCSFFFAWTDAFCPGLERFFGAPVEDGFHAPAVPPSPGSSLVFSVRDERLNLTHVRQRGVLDDEERAVFHRRLESDLRGEA